MLTLFDHQRRAAEIGLKQPRYGFWHDPGTGKTISALAICDQTPMRTLVLAPLSILHSAWMADAKHFPKLKCAVVHGGKASDRRDMIHYSDTDIFITTYETFKRHVDDYLEAGVGRLIVDEGSKLKNQQSGIAKACIEFSDRMTSVYILSGTPAPNGPHEYWPLMRCIDRGVFGDNFFKFAYRYFTPQKQVIRGKTFIKGWNPIPQRREEFLSRLATKSWALRKVDCLDLPEQTDVIRRVTLGAEAADYVRMLEELRIELAGGTELNVSTGAKVMKLRQITGGSIITPDGAMRIGEAKMLELDEILEEIGDRQAVIWAVFTHEINAIIDRLAKSCGAGVGRIDGSVGVGNRSRYIDQFQSGKLRYMVCHPAAAGHGITLTAANYSIFYSMDFSAENYEQAKNRVHRIGQHHPVTHYHLLCDGTIDQAVYGCVRKKRKGAEAAKEFLSEVAMGQFGRYEEDAEQQIS